jgi:ADP-ribose pyrophosphatase YjhB (NUDIX family)
MLSENDIKRTPGPAGTKHQRFAVYALATDPVDRILLARIAAGYPGAGLWHLPGGGTDWGEAAEPGLLRELAEETDQRGRITGVLGVSHRHSPSLGPEGVWVDLHGVRVTYRVLVDEPRPARVMEAGGSTERADWFAPAQAARLPATEPAQEAIAAVARSVDHRP